MEIGALKRLALCAEVLADQSLEEKGVVKYLVLGMRVLAGISLAALPDQKVGRLGGLFTQPGRLVVLLVWFFAGKWQVSQISILVKGRPPEVGRVMRVPAILGAGA